MRRRITIKGFVQGVGFRHFTVKTAKMLGVKGFVKNQMDGTVYVEAQSDSNTLKMFILNLWEGPSSSDVSDIIETEMIDVPGEAVFRVSF